MALSYALCIEYLGPRDARPLKDHLITLLPSNVQLIKGVVSKAKSKGTVSLDAFLEEGVRYRGKVKMGKLLFSQRLCLLCIELYFDKSHTV
jgi:hypothetical protein